MADCVYYTRHGETEWNQAGRICGSTDVTLTLTGQQQAHQLGSFLREQSVDIDEILVSPLARAQQTAAILSGCTGWPVRTEERLREQNFGKYEATLRENPAFQRDARELAQSFHGGESVLRLAQRIYNLLDEIRTQDRIFLLVAHDGIAKSVNSYFHDMTNEEYGAFRMKNCQLLRFDFR